MKISVVIPARLASKRFPEKVLADLGGKSVLRRVWERTLAMRLASEIIIATDAEKIAEHAQAFGARVEMTSPDCPNGTARIASLLDKISGDFIINVQGDEPFVEPALLDALGERAKTATCDMVTAVYPLTDTQQLTNPNLVKVIRTAEGRALYFSRAAVPHMRDFPLGEWINRYPYWGHIGVYGYSRALLATYNQLPPSPLENIECLEQLRFLEHGYTIQTVETTHSATGIDTPADLANAIRHLNAISDV